MVAIIAVEQFANNAYNGMASKSENNLPLKVSSNNKPIGERNYKTNEHEDVVDNDKREWPFAKSQVDICYGNNNSPTLSLAELFIHASNAEVPATVVIRDWGKLCT